VRRLGERRYGAVGDSLLPLPAASVGGKFGGHDLALAHLRDTTYFTSVHGRRHHDADAAMLLATLLTADAARSENGYDQIRGLHPRR
jgi:hypothetical protein